MSSLTEDEVRDLAKILYILQARKMSKLVLDN